MGTFFSISDENKIIHFDSFLVHYCILPARFFVRISLLNKMDISISGLSLVRLETTLIKLSKYWP